jgi:L-aminopeptidase/D-esterase-like protein
MSRAAILPQGLLVGHWTDEIGRTGCTVIIAPDGATGGVDVRGAASSTLCTDVLRPATLVDQVHGVLLTGGSAFGLEAAAGVLRYLEAHGIGYELAGVRVPIVAGAVIFDLPVGDAKARPDIDAGYAACADATARPATGAVGAGTGATVAKGGTGVQVRPGGVGILGATVGDATVAAVMVVNSVGGIWDDERHEWVAEFTSWDRSSSLVPGANTTIGAVLTDATLSTEQANRIATVAHDGIARAIRPAHTMYDGDTMFCLATGVTSTPYDALEALATELVAKAIADGVRLGQRASPATGG